MDNCVGQFYSKRRRNFTKSKLCIVCIEWNSAFYRITSGNCEWNGKHLSSGEICIKLFVGFIAIQNGLQNCSLVSLGLLADGQSYSN